MSEKICLIGGTSLMESKLFSDFNKISVKNHFGQVYLFRKKNIFFIQRHYGDLPPHRINYSAYIQYLADQKVKKIITINSVGSLKKEIKVPSLLLPDDFISPWRIPTFYDNEIKHITPNFDNNLRKLIFKIGESLNIKIYFNGVYFQSNGPRLETQAEIKLFAQFADVVGMTLGYEVTLANEKNINIAAICTVDNYANGIRGGVNFQQIKTGAKANLKTVEAVVEKILLKFSRKD